MAGSSMYDDLLVELECPICTDYMSPPIYQCATGHSICSTCRSKLLKCALCQQVYTESRNISLEGLAMKMRYPCINRNAGCNAMLFYTDRVTHELRCTMKGYRCALCAWVGRLEDLADHWASKKNGCRPYTKANVVQTKLKAESYFANIVKAYDKMFWFKCKVTANKLYWVVQYIGNAAEAENYAYEVEVFKQGSTKRQLLVGDYCKAIDLEHSQLFRDDTCISIPTDTLSSFENADRVLSYFLRVNPVNQSGSSSQAVQSADNVFPRRTMGQPHKPTRSRSTGPPHKGKQLSKKGDPDGKNFF